MKEELSCVFAYPYKLIMVESVARRQVHCGYVCQRVLTRAAIAALVERTEGSGPTMSANLKGGKEEMTGSFHCKKEKQKFSKKQKFPGCALF